MPEPQGGSGQALTFSVGDERLALDAAEVAEVLRKPPLRRVPLAPAGLAGLANLRGAVLPVVSLAELLGRARSEGGGERVIVTRGADPVGLLVDTISALVPTRSIRSGEEPARMLAIDSLIEKNFGALERKSGSAGLARAAAAETPAAAERSFLSFEIKGQQFALPLDSVGEVIALPAEVALVPETDDAMLGMISLRDHLLPLVSLPILLGLGEAARDRNSRIVVASVGGIRLGLVVDRVREIVRASDDQIDPVPAVLTRGRQEARIQAICRLDSGRRLVSILSTDHLLEAGLIERLASGAAEEDDVTEAAREGTEQFVIFQLGDENYGLPIGCVEEVVRAPDKLTRLPRAPAFVAGVLNVRGRVVPVIDQRARFESRSDGGNRSRILIVRIGEAEAGFLVDGVSTVLRVPGERLRDTPALAYSGQKVIDRIANLEIEGQMYLLVDPQELLDKAERDMLAGLGRGSPANS